MPETPMISPPDARDWTEDSSHENGDYLNVCCLCGEHFIGHKRRPACKLCCSTSIADTPLSSAEREALIAEVETMEVDHAPAGYPAITMSKVSRLAAECRRLASQLAEWKTCAETNRDELDTWNAVAQSVEAFQWDGKWYSDTATWARRVMTAVVALQAERPADEGAVAAERERCVAIIKQAVPYEMETTPTSTRVVWEREKAHFALELIGAIRAVRRIPAPPAKRAEPAS